MKTDFLRSLAALITATAICFTPSVSATAASNTIDVVAPCYEIAQVTISTLTLSGTTASCVSRAAGGVKISAVQTLEKHSGWFWIWNEVDGANWTKTVVSSTLIMSNTKTGLDSGTYRLKTVFTLTASNGETETITVYSEEKTVS